MEVEELMKYMLNLFQNTNNQIKMKYDELSQKDLELSDLDHYLENNKLNAPQLTKVAKLRKKLREERRVIKNDIDAIEVIKKFTDKFNNKMIAGDIIQTLKEKSNLKKRQEKPIYIYRTNILNNFTKEE